MYRSAPILLLATAMLPQERWQESGRTSTGSGLFVDPCFIRRGGDRIVTASIRAPHAPLLDGDFADVALEYLYRTP